MEKIMGETNGTSREGLTIEQLDAVSGGAFPIVMAQMALLRGSSSGGRSKSLGDHNYQID